MKKITKANVKKHARKIREVSEEQFDEMQKGYTKLMGEVRDLDGPGLLLLSFVGVAIILIFNSSIMDLLGFFIFAYPFYLYVQKGGHHEGYCEGYYDHMSKDGAGNSSGKDEKGEHGKQHDKKGDERR